MQNDSLTGRYAVSLTGRDVGRIYVVTGAAPGGRLLCADGVTRSQAAPKSKNQKHLRLLDGTARLPSTDGELAAQISARRANAGNDLIINGRDYSAKR